jgi:DNA-nicking Smr family endonuclease
MRRPRHISPEERALWEHVTRGDKRIQPPERRGIAPGPAADPAKPPAEPSRPAETRPTLPDFRVGQAVDHGGSRNLIAGLAEDRATLPALRMDARSFEKLKRGKLSPEARIDLHGMTLAQAHPALVGFVLSSHAAGRRLVLVITGKGKERDDHAPIPVRQGLLRNQVPHWLATAPLAPLVLQVQRAHASHGGSGALYVYLRRRR